MQWYNWPQAKLDPNTTGKWTLQQLIKLDNGVMIN